MFLTATVTKWQDNKFSGGRVSPRDTTGRQFILNTSYMYDIRANGTGSKLYFADRRLDRREKGSYMEIDQSVADIRTAGDTVVSKLITLPVYRNNNPNRATDNIIISTDSLIYADRYNGSPLDLSWVMIEETAFKIKPSLALVALSLEDILSESSLLKDYDGNGYTTTIIGSQEWIVENLKVTHYSDGTDVSLITDDDLWQADTDGAYCFYENDETNFDFTGILYNWYAASNIKDIAYFERSGVQEIGWRVPTFNDWTALMLEIGGLLHGGDLKEIGTVHWTPPNIGATDIYGFKGISGGNRYIDEPLGDGFSGQGRFGDMWSTTPIDALEANSVYLINDNPLFASLEAKKFYGMNIRCVRDV